MLGISVNKNNLYLLPDYTAAGFTVAEMLLPSSDGTPQDMTNILAYGAQTAAQIRAAGLTLRTVHLPFSITTWNPSHPDLAARQAAVDGQSAMLHACAAWGVPYAVLHASCGPVPNEYRPWWEENCNASLRSLSARAQACGVRILVENLVEVSLTNGSAPLLRVTENGALADICFDVNHVFMETHQSFVQATGPLIRGTHLSDYDGKQERHWLPGMGAVPWKQVVQDLKNIGYDGPWLFELRPDESGEPYAPHLIAERFAQLIA